MSDVVHILLSKIQKGNFRCSRTKWFTLSKNMEDRVGWSLALAYMLCLYKLH